MYFDFKVKIPEVPGKIIVKKKGDTFYVLYEVDRKYNKDKKFNVPVRVIIGKVCSEDPTLMYPNEMYQQHFPNAVMPEERPSAYRSCCLRIGSYVIVKRVIEEYGLYSVLRKYLNEDTGLFLDLVSYLIVDEENAGQYYPDFAYTHPLFSTEMKIFSDTKVSRFLSSLTTEQTIGFLNDWNDNKDKTKRIYVSYDSTNKNCQAGDVDIVEFGKAKDDKGLPIFNLSLAFDSTNRVPLFYEEYPGSINDVSQFSFMVDKVKQYKYRKMGFILDRGYFSKSNINYIDDNKFSFVIMVKGCKVLVSEKILELKNTFETNRDNSIRSYRVYGTTVKSKLYEDDKKDRYFHIYYNPARCLAEREQLETKIDRLKGFLLKHEGKPVLFGNTYKDYFNLHYSKDGNFLFAEERKDVIRRELELCGYFCIITSDKMTAEEALIIYKGRDISEKLFRSDKSFLGSKSMRVQSSESISAKIFVEFVALIIRNRIYNLLKEEMMHLEKKPNFMTVPAAIRELEKIEMIRRSNGKYRLDHAITRNQKTILAAFGIDDEYIKTKATEIGNLLSTGASLEDTITGEETDGQDEEYYDN